MFKRNANHKKKRKAKDEDEEFVAPVDGLKMPNDDFNEDLRLQWPSKNRLRSSVRVVRKIE